MTYMLSSLMTRPAPWTRPEPDLFVAMPNEVRQFLLSYFDWQVMTHSYLMYNIMKTSRRHHEKKAPG